MSTQSAQITPRQVDKACPFCGSSDSIRNDWVLADKDTDAVECNSCFAGAPLDIWNGDRACDTKD